MGLFWIRMRWWSVFHSKSGTPCHPVHQRVMLPQQGILPPQRHPIILPLQGIASTPTSSVCLFACQHVGCLWSSSLKRWRYPREAEDDLDEVGENTPTKCHLVNRNLWLLYTKAIYTDSSLYAFRHRIYGENPFISLMPSVGILFRLKHTGGVYYGSAPHTIKHDITAT